MTKAAMPIAQESQEAVLINQLILLTDRKSMGWTNKVGESFTAVWGFFVIKCENQATGKFVVMNNDHRIHTFESTKLVESIKVYLDADKEHHRDLFFRIVAQKVEDLDDPTKQPGYRPLSSPVKEE